MFNQRIPSDAVKAVFHYLKAGEIFSSNTRKINEAFYEISKIDKFSDLFNDFIFDTSKGFPSSQIIRYALDRLQKADLLFLRNLDLDEYEVSKALVNKSDIEELFPKR